MLWVCVRRLCWRIVECKGGISSCSRVGAGGPHKMILCECIFGSGEVMMEFRLN